MTTATPEQTDSLRAAKTAAKDGADVDALAAMLTPFGTEARKVAAKLAKNAKAAPKRTSTPGVFKRGGGYAISYRLATGEQKWESFDTLEEARAAKSARTTDIRRGEFDPKSRITVNDYALDWIGRYEGNGKHPIRKGTRKEYKRQLDQYVLKAPGLARLKMTEVTPSDVARFAKWLREQTKPAPTKDDPDRQVPLADGTVKGIMAPLQAMFSTAVQEGIIRSNPAREVRIKRQQVIEDGEEQAKAMTSEQLATILALIPSEWQLFFRFLAATGLRISEAIALEWRHVKLDGSHPHIEVRQGIVDGDKPTPPKSRYGRRDVPISHEIVTGPRKLQKDTEWPGDGHPVFAAGNGSPLTPGNVFRRVLQPAREEADLAWVGFHTFRHTCASMLFAKGRNAVQVQRWLGHHSPAFTLARYVHLMDGDLGGPLTLPEGANKVQTDATPSEDIAETESPEIPASE